MTNLRDDELWKELYNQILNLQKKSQGQATGGAAPLEGYVRYDRNPYEEIQNDKSLSADEKCAKIRELSSAREKEINDEYRKKIGKLYGGAALEIGSAAIPWALGGRVAATGYKLAKPLISQIAKKELTKGAVEGMVSGAVSGLGRGMIEDKNPLQTAAQDAGTGLAAGAGLGKLAGKIHEKTPRIKDLDEVLDKRQDWGIAYRKQSGKPEEAVDKLLQEKQGFVPKAFNKDGIGDVDLVWGKQDYQTGQGYGFEHIIDGRNRKNKIDGDKFVRGLPETFENGVVTNSIEHPENLYLEDLNNKIAIPKDYNGKPRNWVLTAHPQNKSASKRLAASAPQLSKPHSSGRSNNFTTELTADNNIIPDKPSYLNSFEDWLKEVRRKRRH